MLTTPRSNHDAPDRLVRLEGFNMKCHVVDPPIVRPKGIKPPIDADRQGALDD